MQGERSLRILGLACLAAVLSLLGACAAAGLASVTASAIAVSAGSVAAVATKDDVPPGPVVRGTYQDGFWFDRDLFSVWVTSDSAEDSKRVAYATAVDACSKRERPLAVLWEAAWDERRLFIPLETGRHSHELRFRCERQSESASE